MISTETKRVDETIPEAELLNFEWGARSHVLSCFRSVQVLNCLAIIFVVVVVLSFDFPPKWNILLFISLARVRAHTPYGTYYGRRNKINIYCKNLENEIYLVSRAPFSITIYYCRFRDIAVWICAFCFYSFIFSFHP